MLWYPQGTTIVSLEQGKDIAAQYGLTRFTLYVFIGGVALWIPIIAVTEYDATPIDTEKIRTEATARYNQTLAAQQYFDQRVSWENAIRVLVSGMVFLVLPLIISYIFTVNHPERRVIPPLFLTYVAAPLLVIYSLIRFSPQSGVYVWLFMAVFVMVMAGWFSDIGMVKLLGLSFDKKHLKTAVVKSKGGSVEQIRGILLERPVRKRLDLAIRADLLEQGSVVLKPAIEDKFAIYVELKNEPLDETVLINFVFFEKGKYFTKDTDELKEFVEDKVSYVMNRLQRARPNPITTTRLDTPYPEFLVDMASENLMGIAAQAERMTRMDKFRISLYFAAFVPVIAFILQTGGWNEGIYALLGTSVGTFAALLVAEASLRLARQRREKLEK